ncbi:MAG TPA: hypothetical protein VKG85_09720 [Actinomycetes bacterium]|nr:hypothetical protein [Actinomycetes bacterium]
MRSRTAHRALVLAVTVGVTLLATAAPALAREQDAGSDPGESLSPLATLLIFGALPVGIFLLIALLVSAGSIAGGTRYRPDRVWDATPVEFGLPAQPAPAGQLTRSADTDPDGPDRPPPAGTADDADATASQPTPPGPADDQPGGGGVSARW